MRGAIDGNEATMVMAAAGELATPAMQSLEDAFINASEETLHADLTQALALPGVDAAAFITTPTHGYTIEVGNGRAYCQRKGQLVRQKPARHDHQWSDAWLVCSTPVPEHIDFFGLSSPAFENEKRAFAYDLETPQFHEGTLDDILWSSLSKYTEGAAASATWTGFMNELDASRYRGKITERVRAAMQAVRS